MGVIDSASPVLTACAPHARCVPVVRSFPDLLPAARDLARSHHQIVSHAVPKGSRLVVEGDECGAFHILAKGWALKYKSSVEGRRQIVDFALPGDVLGFVEAQQAPYAIDMLTDGEVIAIPRSMFDSIVGSQPDFARQVCHQLEAAETRAYDRIVSIGYRSASRRVCQLLVEFVERLEGVKGVFAASEWPLPLRQQDLGDALGLRVETVCRVLVDLRRRGIAIVRRGRLRVLAMDALIAESMASPDPNDALEAPEGHAASWPREADRHVDMRKSNGNDRPSPSR